MKTTNTIFIMTGKKGVGKTYYSKLINKGTDKIISFAFPLKNDLNMAAQSLYGINAADLTGDNKTKFRPMMQLYGKLAREVDGEFWVNKAKDKIALTDHSIRIFIDDCRFENELDAFKDYNIIKVRIKRTSVFPGIDNDPSEIGLDHLEDSAFDVIITNDTTDEQAIDMLEAAAAKYV